MRSYTMQKIWFNFATKYEQFYAILSKEINVFNIFDLLF